MTTQYPVKMLHNTKLKLCLLLWMLFLCMIVHVSLTTKLLSTDLARVHRTSIVMLRVIYFSWVFIIINPNPSAISLFSILFVHIFENARACLCLFCFCQSAEWRNCRVRLLSVLKRRLKTKMQSVQQKSTTTLQTIKQNILYLLHVETLAPIALLRSCLDWIGFTGGNWCFGR